MNTAPPPDRQSVRGSLTKRSIAVASLEIIDDVGLQAFSTRKLADKLNTSSMAVYWHFPSKASLLDAVGDAVASEIASPAYNADACWEDAIAGCLQAVLEVLRRHPAAAELAIRRLLFVPEGRALAERALTALDEAGVPPGVAMTMTRLALRLTTAVATEMVFTGLDDSPEHRQELEKEFDEASSHLDPRTHPHLSGLATALKTPEAIDTYRSMFIQLFIAGVREQTR